MDINVTIFVQIINFWITYGLLHRFFLKPMVAFIQQKECAFEGLQDTLRRKETTVQLLQKNKLDQLVVFKTHIKDDYKMAEYASVERQIPMLDQAQSIADKQNAVAQCKQVIIKKVCNVCSCSDM